MYSSSREEAVAAFDNLDTALNRVLKVSPDDLTIPECLAMLQRCEKIRRRLPAAEHPFINKLADQTDQTELGGIALIRFSSAATTLLSRLLPPSSLGIDWSSMMVAATPADAVTMVSARVARMESSPTDKVEGSAGKLVTGLLGGLTSLTRKPALASLASCSGLCKYLANALAADVCSCDSHAPLSSTVG